MDRRIPERGRLALERRLDLPAPAETVWSVIGHFATLDSWMPGVTGLELTGDGIGAVRTCHTILGRFEELLEELGRRSYTYAMLTGPLPVKDYHATLTVVAVSPTSCQVIWNSHFHAADGVDDRSARGAVEAVYAVGLGALARQFRWAPTPIRAW
jgi:hypothetical protein